MPADAFPACAVTGTGGYVGGALARALEAHGAGVLKLSRAGGFSLERPPAPATFSDAKVSVLVHCAYDFSVSSWPAIRRVNVDGSLRLFDAAARGGVGRIIFVSSLAAFDGCASLYGRGKMAVEVDVLGRGGHAIRPGTVFGPQPKGIMGSLTAQVMGAGWIPAIRHPGALFLAHEDDLAAFVSVLAAGHPSTSDGAGRPWLAAGPRAWNLEGLVSEMARRAKRNVHVVPVPWRMVWSGLRLLEAAGLKPSFRSDSVLSLGHPIPPEQLAGLQVAPVPFRDY